jgi:hypothetical protein
MAIEKTLSSAVALSCLFLVCLFVRGQRTAFGKTQWSVDGQELTLGVVRRVDSSEQHLQTKRFELLDNSPCQSLVQVSHLDQVRFLIGPEEEDVSVQDSVAKIVLQSSTTYRRQIWQKNSKTTISLCLPHPDSTPSLPIPVVRIICSCSAS